MYRNAYDISGFDREQHVTVIEKVESYVTAAQLNGENCTYEIKRDAFQLLKNTYNIEVRNFHNIQHVKAYGFTIKIMQLGAISFYSFKITVGAFLKDINVRSISGKLRKNFKDRFRKTKDKNFHYYTIDFKDEQELSYIMEIFSQYLY